MPNVEEVLGAAAAIARGMGVTLKEMLSPAITETYPDEPPRFQERYRGVHVLERDENGMEKCVACFLCAAACPANCIYIEAAENTDAERISGGERYAKWRPAPPTPSPTATASRLPTTTPRRSSTARTGCCGRRRPRPRLGPDPPPPRALGPLGPQTGAGSRTVSETAVSSPPAAGSPGSLRDSRVAP